MSAMGHRPLGKAAATASRTASSALVPLVALRRQPIHLEPLEDPPDARDADRDVVVALQIHRDSILCGPKWEFCRR